MKTLWHLSANTQLLKSTLNLSCLNNKGKCSLKYIEPLLSRSIQETTFLILFKILNSEFWIKKKSCFRTFFWFRAGKTWTRDAELWRLPLYPWATALWCTNAKIASLFLLAMTRIRSVIVKQTAFSIQNVQSRQLFCFFVMLVCLGDLLRPCIRCQLLRQYIPIALPCHRSWCRGFGHCRGWSS